MLAEFPIDHSVQVAAIAGGAVAAEKRLASFLDTQLAEYDESRNHPGRRCHQRPLALSALRPPLGPRSVRRDHAAREMVAGEVGRQSHRQLQGWWGVGASAEAFLDQLVTWRELGFNMCSQRDDFDRYESLPEWARKTLAEHADDPARVRLFARRVRAGRRRTIRSGTPPSGNSSAKGGFTTTCGCCGARRFSSGRRRREESLAVMIELNNKYALDGRDPNSYSGIFWILGRYDRAWGPERPIFGKIRYMSSANTARKLHVKKYLETVSAPIARLAAGSNSSRRAPRNCRSCSACQAASRPSSAASSSATCGAAARAASASKNNAANAAGEHVFHAAGHFVPRGPDDLRPDMRQTLGERSIRATRSTRQVARSPGRRSRTEPASRCRHSPAAPWIGERLGAAGRRQQAADFGRAIDAVLGHPAVGRPLAAHDRNQRTRRHADHMVAAELRGVARIAAAGQRANAGEDGADVARLRLARPVGCDRFQQELDLGRQRPRLERSTRRAACRSCRPSRARARESRRSRGRRASWARSAPCRPA